MTDYSEYETYTRVHLIAISRRTMPSEKQARMENLRARTRHNRAEWAEFCELERQWAKIESDKRIALEVLARKEQSK